MRIFTFPAVVGLLVGGLLMPARAADKNGATRTITVIGAGEVSARPDMAAIQVGVVTQAAAAVDALQANNTAMERLLKLLVQRGIEEKDVQTSNFAVFPQYKRGPQGQQENVIVGYQVSNQVQVKVRKLATLGAVLDELIAGGANQVQGISFGVAESTRLEDAARERALADAHRKAALYAKGFGTQVGRVLHITEESGRIPRQEFGFAGGRAQAAAVPIATGESTFHASITVTFALE